LLLLHSTGDLQADDREEVRAAASFVLIKVNCFLNNKSQTGNCCQGSIFLNYSPSSTRPPPPGHRWYRRKMKRKVVAEHHDTYTPAILIFILNYKKVLQKFVTSYTKFQTKRYISI
jgi:hypothetical protein